MEKIERRFTRADVEAFFNRHWGRSQEFKNELQSIDLLTDVVQPMWIVRYTSAWARFGTSVLNTLIVTQFQMSDGSYYLNLPNCEKLPEDCATPAEEDATIARIETEKVAAWKACQERRAC